MVRVSDHHQHREEYVRLVSTRATRAAAQSSSAHASPIRSVSAPAACAVFLAVLAIVVGCSATNAPAPSSTSATAKNPVNRDLIRCIADAGFEAEETWNGGVMNKNTPPEQLDVFSAAVNSCAETLGLATFALTDAQLAELYEQELVERDCLIAEGFGVDDPPSLHTYIDTWNTEARWTAWDSSDAAIPTGFDPDRDTSLELQQALAQRCPPPSWWLNLEGL